VKEIMKLWWRKEGNVRKLLVFRRGCLGLELRVPVSRSVSANAMVLSPRSNFCSSLLSSAQSGHLVPPSNPISRMPRSESSPPFRVTFLPLPRLCHSKSDQPTATTMQSQTMS
jgi:hypothetical protein